MKAMMLHFDYRKNILEGWIRENSIPLKGMAGAAGDLAISSRKLGFDEAPNGRRAGFIEKVFPLVKDFFAMKSGGAHWLRLRFSILCPKGRDKAAYFWR